MKRTSQKLVLLFSAIAMLLAPMPGLLAMPMQSSMPDCDSHVMSSSTHQQHSQSAQHDAVSDAGCPHCQQNTQECIDCDCNLNGCMSGKIQIMHALGNSSFLDLFVRVIPKAGQVSLLSLATPPLLRPPIQ